MEPTGGNYLEEEGNVIHGDTASQCPLRAHEPDASYCNAIGKESGDRLMLLDYVYLVWSSSLLAQDLADLLQGKTKILIIPHL